MQLNDLWEFIQNAVFTEPSTPVLFNPYHDATPGFDKTDAASIRCENLKNYHFHFVHHHVDSRKSTKVPKLSIEKLSGLVGEC